MNMVFVLVLLSLALAVVAVWSLIWAINKNQFDDLDSPAYSILDDEWPDVFEYALPWIPFTVLYRINDQTIEIMRLYGQRSKFLNNRKS